MDYIDLHLHTHFSDGADAPAVVVERAAAKDIAGIAITDHDSVRGVEEAAAAASARGLAFLTGVEISAAFQEREIHILGLGIDITDADLLRLLDALLAARDARATRIIGRLQESGIDIEEAAVDKMTGGHNIGRMHIARMLHNMGVTKTTQESFDRFLKPGGAGYVPKALAPAGDAIAAIRQAGGLAFLAHPGLGGTTSRMLPQLLQLPFDGIEAYHVSHTPGRTKQYLELAESEGLLITGGSDCHGAIKGKPEMGKVKTPVEFLTRIQEALERVRHLR
jgi:3',5'-nucleoside bisphosphate phosphatase